MTTAREIMRAGAECIGAHETLAQTARRMRDLDVGAAGPRDRSARMFEEPGTLDAAAGLARDWFITHLTRSLT